MRDVLIVSGGQTGADRAALDFALEHGLRHAGWCPRGRWAEDGPLDARYGLRETRSADPAERTRLNVRDSDATVILTRRGELAGGSALTRRHAERLGRPCLVLADRGAPAADGRRLVDFLERHGVARLDVAGPRASTEPTVGDYVRAVLAAALAEADRRGLRVPESEVLWLRPCAAQRPALEREIERLATRLDAHPFAPHVTAWSRATKRVEPVPDPPLPVRFGVVGTARSAEMRRSLVLELAADESYRAWLARVAGAVDRVETRPHLSLAYTEEALGPGVVPELALDELVVDAVVRVRVPRLPGDRVDPRTWSWVDGGRRTDEDAARADA